MGRVRKGISFEAGLWLFCIPASYASAFFLPPLDTRQAPNPAVALLGVTGFAALAVAIFLHIYKSWRRFPAAPNRVQYALWMTFITALALSLVSVVFAMGRR